MKVCPVCHSRCFDDMEICYGCLHRFEDESWEVADPPARILSRFDVETAQLEDPRVNPGTTSHVSAPATQPTRVVQTTWMPQVVQSAQTSPVAQGIVRVDVPVMRSNGEPFPEYFGGSEEPWVDDFQQLIDSSEMKESVARVEKAEPIERAKHASIPANERTFSSQTCVSPHPTKCPDSVHMELRPEWDGEGALCIRFEIPSALLRSSEMLAPRA